MATIAQPGSTSGTRPDLLPLTLIIASWVLMVLLMTGDHTHHLSHDSVLAGRTVPAVSTLLLFLAAWQVMTGAMMLPSSLPLIQMFTGISRKQDRPRLVMAVFIGAYFAVWTGFAFIALAFDGVVHVVVGQWSWLADRPHLIAGSVLVTAGAFQFSKLKERCLDACRSPMGFLYQHYRRGPKGAWNLGLRHGLFCLGCCWALMLVMFAVGIGSLAGMAGLTGVMTIEKAFPWGRRIVPVVGIGLIVWGIALVIATDALPSALQV
jgi:predicted metal-binding membrane protein